MSFEWCQNHKNSMQIDHLTSTQFILSPFVASKDAWTSWISSGRDNLLNNLRSRDIHTISPCSFNNTRIIFERTLRDYVNITWNIYYIIIYIISSLGIPVRNELIWCYSNVLVTSKCLHFKKASFFFERIILYLRINMHRWRLRQWRRRRRGQPKGPKSYRKNIYVFETYKISYATWDWFHLDQNCGALQCILDVIQQSQHDMAITQQAILVTRLTQGCGRVRDFGKVWHSEIWCFRTKCGITKILLFQTSF